jgi:hypothetical protein
MKAMLALILAANVALAEDIQPPVPADARNPWPAEWERAFQERMQEAVAESGDKPLDLSWSNEKSGGGFMAFLKGRREEALASMRIQPPGCGHTAGIDFYWCFHLEKQPRYYFQFGKFQPPEFIAKMKEGAKNWTTEDPRPNLELILQLDCPDAEVVAHAKMQLGKMWRDADGVRELIAAARGEGKSANKQAFAAYLESVLPQWPKAMPATIPEWRAWWKLISDGDWKIYEEYERRTNPRPHPKFGIGTGPVGDAWDPQVRGGWVDWRNTDNLRSMREVSVYLFAEETGNELVRKVYKERIRRTARGFYSVGNGEWDSPAYIGLTVQGYLMLYDFARDPEVRLLAKGILDYLATATALKFFHGGASGPNTRDYGTWASGRGGSGSRAWSTWLPVTRGIKPPGGYAEMVLLSAYRPPAAVVALAGDEVTKPWEHLATHPQYNNWVPGGDDEPAYHETLYRSRDFQMGSQVEGGSYDGSGGKIVLAHPERGCDYFLVTSKTKGNPCVGGNDRIAQCRNALIWASHTAKDWRVLLPPDAAIERERGIVFLKFARGWAAVHPLRCELGEPDAALVSPFLGKTGTDAGGAKPAQTALPAKPASDGLTGFAIEMADGLHFADYAAFKAATLAKAKAQVAGNRAEFAAASGARVALTWDGQAKLPAVERDGKAHDWEKHRAMWQGGPATLGWKEGRLMVESGGRKFTGALDLRTGTYRFE